MTRLVTYCLENHAELSFSFFFGLMLASILVVTRDIKKWTFTLIAISIMTTVFTFWLVSRNPISNTTDLSYLYVFICGCIAICAMLLPGISGSYLLLILGVYHSVLSSVKSLTTPSNWLNGFEDIRTLWPPLLLLVFIFGCIVGIKSFSGLLNYLLKKHDQIMTSLACGLMIGSLRAIWPWQSRPDLKLNPNDAQEVVLRLPEINSQFWCGLALCILGFVLTFLMEICFKKDKTIS